MLATSISSLLLEYDVSQLLVELDEGKYTLLLVINSRAFPRWLIQNYKRYKITRDVRDFVSVNWEFSQFSTSSPATSLPVHGTLLRQNKSTLGPKKTCFGLFEIFLQSELVCTYDKLNIYTKKSLVIGTLTGWRQLLWNKFSLVVL